MKNNDNQQIDNLLAIEKIHDKIEITTKITDTEILINGNIHFKVLVHFKVDRKTQAKYNLLVISDLVKSIITE